MTYLYDDYSDAEQLRARQVGEASPVRSQQPAAFENVAHTDAQIDQLIERVRWLMRREPMLEGRELRIEK